MPLKWPALKLSRTASPHPPPCSLSHPSIVTSGASVELGKLRPALASIDLQLAVSYGLSGCFLGRHSPAIFHLFANTSMHVRSSRIFPEYSEF